MRLKDITKKAILMSMAFALTFTGSINAKAYIEESWNESQKLHYYYNTDTNDSCVSTKSKDHATYAYVYPEENTKTISTESYDSSNGIKLYTSYDVARFGNFRTNKKALKFKVVRKVEDNYTNSEYYVTGTDGKKYCKNVFGNKSEYSAATEAEAAKTNKYHAYGEYSILFNTKKTGTFKFYYDALDQNGNVILTKTVKVIAKEDGQPIKEATFAGKRFYVNDYGKYKGIETNLYTSKDRAYTTKSSGKLKFKMNNGFKLRKIEVGYYPMGYTKNSTVDHWTLTQKDIVWTEVKNGKKITLNDTDEGFCSYEKDIRHITGRGYRTSSSQTLNQRATTTIRVTYYDKKNKTTKRSIFYIYKLINK